MSRRVKVQGCPETNRDTEDLLVGASLWTIFLALLASTERPAGTSS